MEGFQMGSYVVWARAGVPHSWSRLLATISRLIAEISLATRCGEPRRRPLERPWLSVVLAALLRSEVMCKQGVQGSTGELGW